MNLTSIKTVLKGALTEQDGKTFCLISLFIYIAMAAVTYKFLTGGATTYQDYALSMTILAGGKAIKYMSDSQN